MSMADFAFKGQTPQLKALLTSSPSDVNKLSKDRQTSLLYTAARFGHTDMVKMLVEDFNADMNIQNGENLSTPLHGAAFGGHPEIVRYLLWKGANFTRNAYKESPLDNAQEPADGVTTADASECVKVLSWRNSTVAALKKECAARGIPVPSGKPTLAHVCSLLCAPPAPPAPVPAPAPAPAAPPVPTASPVKVAPEHEKEETEADLPPAKKTKTTAAAAKKASPPASPKAKKSPAPKPKASPKASKAAEDKKEEQADTTDKKFTDEYLASLKSAKFVLTDVEKDTEPFWELEEKVSACCQGRNDDYVKDRLKKKKKPITFILKSAQKVNNPLLEELFKKTRERIIKERGEGSGRVRTAFHGTNPKHLDSILKTSLLRFKHPLNPCTTQADDGYFGTNKKGVYVSRYFDYTLKYSNDLTPLDVGQSAKVIMFKALPGKTCHIEKLNMGMDPTPGYDSHSSPSFLEWYMFDEHQLCPEYVVEILAKEDTRTATDDE
eukprot:PhM_4_TR17940/c0_g1_i1/m.72227